MSCSIGMLGPILVSSFRNYLFPNSWRDNLPVGLGGTPVNLLCKELLDRGRKLIVFSLDPSVKEEVILEGPNLRICIGPFRPNRARDFFAEEINYLISAIMRENPDILHAQWTYEYALAAQASGIAHVITAHDAPINVLRHGFIPYRIARTLMAYAVLLRAKRVVSVSPYVEKHLRRFMFYRGGQEVIPNGMPATLFENNYKKNLNKNCVVFACILPGWGGLKNGQAAIEAFSHHRSKHPNNRLVMFGHGHGPGEGAEKWAKSKGWEQGIDFVGNLPYENVMQRLATEVDVLVHPSLEEAQPMVLIEAMALKIPVIGGESSGGVPWTLDSGNAGVLVDVRSIKKISNAMTSLSTDLEIRLDIGLKGYQLAMNRFHMNVVADRYEAIYKELLDK